MKILGKEYGFLLSVGAEQELARLCPEGELGKLGEALRGNTESSIYAGKEVICILSRWYEKAQSFSDPGYEPQPLSHELLDLLPVATYREVQAEAMAAFARDRQQTVEAEDAKKNEGVKSN